MVEVLMTNFLILFASYTEKIACNILLSNFYFRASKILKPDLVAADLLSRPAARFL